MSAFKLAAGQQWCVWERCCCSREITICRLLLLFPSSGSGHAVGVPGHGEVTWGKSLFWSEHWGHDRQSDLLESNKTTATIFRGQKEDRTFIRFLFLAHASVTKNFNQELLLKRPFLLLPGAVYVVGNENLLNLYEIRNFYGIDFRSHWFYPVL